MFFSSGDRSPKAAKFHAFYSTSMVNTIVVVPLAALTVIKLFVKNVEIFKNKNCEGK
jgi:hypothetical protein